MTTENLNPSEAMNLSHQVLIKRALTYCRKERRAQLGAFVKCWTPQENNSIADIAKIKNKN